MEIKVNPQLVKYRRGLAQPAAGAWKQTENICQSGLENLTTLLPNTARNKEPAMKVGDVVVHIDPRYFCPAEVETLLGDPTKAKAKLVERPKSLPKKCALKWWPKT